MSIGIIFSWGKDPEPPFNYSWLKSCPSIHPEFIIACLDETHVDKGIWYHDMVTYVIHCTSVLCVYFASAMHASAEEMQIVKS